MVPEATHIRMCICVSSISTEINRPQGISASNTESNDDQIINDNFNTNRPPNLTGIEQAIGDEGMQLRASLLYANDYLTPDTVIEIKVPGKKQHNQLAILNNDTLDRTISWPLHLFVLRKPRKVIDQ